MRVVGPGSSKSPLTAKEIEARLESELLYLESLQKRGLSDDEKQKRLHELSRWYVNAINKLPAVQAAGSTLDLLKDALKPRTPKP